MNGDVRISGEYPQQLCHRDNSAVLNQSTLHNQGRYDPAYVIAPPPQVGSDHQHKTAAAFFAKKNKKGGSIPASPRRSCEQNPSNDHLMNGFAGILGRCPPPPPGILLKKMLEPRDNQGLGKVRVYLRVMTESGLEHGKADFFKMDKKKKQVTLLGPERVEDGAKPDQYLEKVGSNPVSVELGLEKKPLDVLAPRMFAFDGVFTDEDTQSELSSSCLPEFIQSAVFGTDATLFSFGHSNLGKSFTMLGRDESSRSIGIIPTSISWIFRCVKEVKEKTGMRLTIKVSALEIAGNREELRDLLVSLRGQEVQHQVSLESKLHGSGFQSLTEVRASSAEKAGYLLDYALARRIHSTQGTSHFMLSLHIYQQTANSDQYLGKSRLNLIDFGHCERNLTKGGSITQAGLGHVILGILNGQRHLPFKESRVTCLLKDCLAPLKSLVGMVAHVSPSPPHYSETLHTIQLASRIHRIRRKKKAGGSSGGSGSGSSDENRRLVRLNRIPGLGNSSSDMTTSTDPSSSEQSCDTVIYLGPRDEEGTDAESPPVYLPTLYTGDNRGMMSRVLRGSTAELPPSKYRSLDRKGSCSPRYSLSSQSPPSSHTSTPVRAPSTRSGGSGLLSPGGKRYSSLPRNPQGKMPLYGKVAGYKQPPTPVLHQTPGKSESSGVSKEELWVDTVPVCDKDVISVQYNDNQSIYGYGYMDEHKKQMIQQWVEGQTMVHNTGPPSHLTGIESLAWLEAHSQQSQGSLYRILTQFKMAESSTSSTSDIENQDETARETGTRTDTSKSKSNPGASSQSNAGAGSPGDSGDREDGNLRSRYPEPETLTGNQNLSPNPGEGNVNPNLPYRNQNNPFILPQEPNLPYLLHKNVHALDRRIPESSEETRHEVESVESRGSKVESEGSRGSRKSDMGTSTDLSAPDGPGDKTIYARVNKPAPKANSVVAPLANSGGVPMGANAPRRGVVAQDPYRAQRKVPLRRESLMPDPSSETRDEQESIRTLDELYSHCEQLVETLSQASEEYRVQCQNSESRDSLQYLTIHDPEPDPEYPEPDLEYPEYPEPDPAIDDIEVYEVSEGSEGSIEVVDRSCQVSEEEIIANLSELNHPKGSVFYPGALENLNEQSEDEMRDEEMEQEVPRMNAMYGGMDILELQGVCEDVGGSNHEEFFNKKFDQLAKLHQLYQSVSSISAKCQSRLENDKWREQSLERRRTSTSLSALLTDNSSHSSVSDDLHSLCSEPAWLSCSPYVDINKNSTLSLNILDLCSFSGVKNTLTLSSLPGGEGEESIMELNIESRDLQERCDSPILEGIDSELAKYAKLRDLEQAYNPVNQDLCDITDRLSSLRHPDGSSNPDLNQQADPVPKPQPGVANHSPPNSNPALCKPNPGEANPSPPGPGSRFERTENRRMDLNSVTIEKPGFPWIGSLAERSPGNGRSSSGSDMEETPISRTPENQRSVEVNQLPVNTVSDVCKKSEEKGFTAETPVKPVKDLVKPEEKVKVPKFSRLFGSTRKISRSPSQPNKSNEDKVRSKTSKHKLKTPCNINPPETSNKKSKSPLIIIKCSDGSLKKPKVNPCKESKNVKGTLSSEPSSEKKKSRGLFKGMKKTKNQGVNLVKLPGAGTKPNSEPGSELSGYDSGIDVTPRVRGKGANLQNIEFTQKLSRANCRSSGYESIGLESERESLHSYQGTLNHTYETLSPKRTASPLPILEYDKTFVSRLDSLWRFQEIKRLQKQQEQLKVELSSAKERINVDQKRWSYDLHTQESGLDQTDPTFLEAFQRETEILGKRVAACQAHVVLTTCFDHVVSEDHMIGCTSDCVPSWVYRDTKNSSDM